MSSRAAFVAFVALTAVATTTAAAQTAVASAQNPTRASQPIVWSGLYSISADGKTKGSAVQTGEYVGADLGGSVYLSPCATMGAASGGHQVSAFATDVWVMSGKVLELTDQHASVQVGFRRTKRGGQDETSPEQSVTLTLARGERHRLETITVPAAGSCEQRTAALDVVFGSRAELYGITDDAYARGGSRSSATAGSGYLQGSKQRSGSVGGALALGASGVTSPAGERLTAELWLVRSTPGQPDETQHLASQLMPMPVAYSFPPVTIQTAAGPITIKVEGTIEAGLSPDGQRRFHFAAGRTVTASTSSRPARDVKPLVESSNKVTFAMPEGDEVLGFEMPPLRTPDGTTLPDRLSIRVRISRSPGR
jgi:hypothetical protein